MKLTSKLLFIFSLAMSQALKTTVLPSTPANKPKAAVIFLHGLGGTGANYESLIRPLSPMLPHVKFILPQA
jgi:predicted esterase